MFPALAQLTILGERSDDGRRPLSLPTSEHCPNYSSRSPSLSPLLCAPPANLMQNCETTNIRPRCVTDATRLIESSRGSARFEDRSCATSIWRNCIVHGRTRVHYFARTSRESRECEKERDTARYRERRGREKKSARAKGGERNAGRRTEVRIS